MDPISTLSGPVDAAAFVDGSATASGAKVMAEVAQLLNKTNEIVTGLTVVARDLDTEESARGLADTALDGRLNTAEGEIDLLQASAADHGWRLDVLEETAASYGVVSVINASLSVTGAIAMATRTIVAQRASGATGIGVHLLASADELPGCAPVTILNDNYTTVQVDITNAEASWGGVVTAVDSFIILSARQYITLLPVPSATVQGQVDWHIIGGKTYADIMI